MGWIALLLLGLLLLVLTTTQRTTTSPSESDRRTAFLCSDVYTRWGDHPLRVFAKTDVFHTGPLQWRGHWHNPVLDRPVVLSGQSDHPLTPEITRRFPQVQHWFAINNQSLDPRVTTLPLGLTNDTDESPAHRVLGNTAVLRRVRAEPKPVPGRNLVYMNFALHTHPSRPPLWHWFRAQPWVTVGTHTALTLDQRETFLRAIRQHDFCLAPRGNGLDTHRLWETLYVGSIPVVEYDPAWADFADLPILFVRDWQTEVTPDRLRAVRDDFARRSWNWDKLFVPYWEQTVAHYPGLQARLSRSLPTAGVPSWVLVHLGPSPPPAYLKVCVDQVHRADPSAPVLVVSDTDPGCGLWVPLASVPVSSWRQDFLEHSTVDDRERQGFWKWACLRLFVLHDVMEYARLRSVLHIEYDNLIYFTSAWFLAHLPAAARWACPRLGPHRLLANVFFVRDPEPLRALLTFINAHRYPNEMRYLAAFQAQRPYHPLYELPTSLEHPHFSDFDALFDAAALGQCVGGVDPRNQAGNTVGFVNEDAPWPGLHPSWVTWTADRRPWFRGRCPVQNLHLHSKQLELFTP